MARSWLVGSTEFILVSVWARREGFLQMGVSIEPAVFTGLGGGGGDNHNIVWHERTASSSWWVSFL